MSRITFVLACFIAFALLFPACSKTENKPPETPAAQTTPEAPAPEEKGAPSDVVKASAGEVELTAGGTAQAVVSIKIAEGYHITGNPAGSKFQIATTLDVPAAEGINAGKAVYPPAVSKKFSFSKDPIMVYENEAVIKQPLRADLSATKGSHTLHAKLKVQPCDDKVCYPPRTLDVALPLTVK